MISKTKTRITVQTTINADMQTVWDCWNGPDHITQWNFASEDWTCPWAKVDLRIGGRQSSRMEAKDGSMGFEFGGTYTRVDKPNAISFIMDDDRNVDVSFTSDDEQVKVVETFDAESTNPVDMQQQGWQAILNNFKRYVESLQ